MTSDDLQPAPPIGKVELLVRDRPCQTCGGEWLTMKIDGFAILDHCVSQFTGMRGRDALFWPIPVGRGARLYEAAMRATPPPDTPSHPTDFDRNAGNVGPMERLTALEEYADGLTPRVQKVMHRVTALQQQQTIIEGWYKDLTASSSYHAEQNARHQQDITRLKQRMLRLEDALLDDDDDDD